VRICLIALSLLAGIVIPTSSALAAPLHQPIGAGGIGIRLVDVPAGSGSDPLNRSYLVDRPAPGTSIRRRVEIINSTRSTADVSVYPAAAGLRSGTFGFAPGHGRNELSGWTSVSPGALRLPSGSKAFETVTINVPEDASSGMRYAVIWAEVSARARAPAAGGVTLVNRVGVRMYLSIGPGGTRPANFAIGPLTAERSETGEPLVVLGVRNTGARALDIGGNLTLAKGPGGLRAGPFPVTLEHALAPGDSESVTVRLDKRVPRGPWLARIRLRTGLIQRTATATITFPSPGGAANPAKARVGHGEHRNLILLALLAVAVLALPLYRRRGAGGTATLGRIPPFSPPRKTP
jgi:hypothetical protein